MRTGLLGQLPAAPPGLGPGAWRSSGQQTCRAKPLGQHLAAFRQGGGSRLCSVTVGVHGQAFAGRFVGDGARTLCGPPDDDGTPQERLILADSSINRKCEMMLDPEVNAYGNSRH